MKIVLDECLPRKLKNDRPGHEVKTVPEMGWAGFKNGKLLALIQEQFDVFITADRNLSFQQNTKDLKIGVVVLGAKTNRYDDLRGLVPQILRTLNSSVAGKIVTVSEAQ